MSCLPVIVGPGERMQTALLPRCRASRRRSLDRTHSRRSGLSVRTGLDGGTGELAVRLGIGGLKGRDSAILFEFAKG